MFAGGWTLEAAAGVAGDEDDPAAPPVGASRLETLDGLGRLVDRSLVVVTHADTTRYGMLETIRQYANDRLVASGEAADRRTRHLARFRRLAADAEAGIAGPDMVAWLGRIEADLDNLRTALDWAYETDVPVALEMYVALGAYWRSRSLGSEGVDRMRRGARGPSTLALDAVGHAGGRADAARGAGHGRLVQHVRLRGLGRRRLHRG